MERNLLSAGRETASRVSLALSNTDYALNVAIIYGEAPTRQWAEKVRERLVELVGREAMHCSEWRVNDLIEPGTYWKSVAALAKADVIVVSLYEGERLPSAFYLWVNLWLDVRSVHPGALVALVASPEGLDCEAGETRRYLCAVASQGRLELLECNPQKEPIRGFEERISHLAKAA